MSQIRIQKFMSEKGMASRREAEALILQGRVILNGKTVKGMGVKIDPERDVIKIISVKSDDNKKISARASMDGQTVFDLLPQYRDATRTRADWADYSQRPPARELSGT